MSEIERFIEDAKKGGFEPTQLELKHWGRTMKHLHPVDRHRLVSYVLLDPAAWQAVNKSRKIHIHHRYSMIAFVNKLADGKTIEDALAAISE